MLQLKNETPFAANVAVFPDVGGIDTLYVTIKGTFTLTPAVEIVPEKQPILLADEFWGEPGQSSIKYASEVHLTKPSTDVVLVGSAWAPRGRPVKRLDVSLAVADRKKVVRVFGDREWRPGFWFFPARMTPPAPFESIPLVYERAFGGGHGPEGKKKEVLFETRNPVGRGFAGRRRGKKLKGLPLPNLEDPNHPIRRPKDRPAPAGFGYVAPSWEPRRSYAGTYDDAWIKGRAPYLPKDFNPRFFNAAHPDLVFPKHLAGGERVEVINALRDGALKFRLPKCDVRARVRVAGAEEVPRLNLETVLIEPDENRLSLVWRGAVPCDKKALKIEEIFVESDGAAPKESVP